MDRSCVQARVLTAAFVADCCKAASPLPTPFRHSRAGGNPSPDLASGPTLGRWIPACAGMTL
ncbi:hypothetical protein DAH51_22040 [Sphingobium yanoikuyae]|uniref:Uncharacterized protein n=1 Tax=Sphingobium yanoikuyae TaxID=13690 RepID=A0A430BJN7_SPHYA|nr:hypothetical protein DAH51_22040 [Sphingobium yanoikuyae]